MSELTTEVIEIEIPDNVEVIYPDDELKQFKKCMSLRGFKALCSSKTGVAINTLKAMMENKKGQNKQVSDVRAFVAAFIAQSKKMKK